MRSEPGFNRKGREQVLRGGEAQEGGGKFGCGDGAMLMASWRRVLSARERPFWGEFKPLSLCLLRGVKADIAAADESDTVIL